MLKVNISGSMAFCICGDPASLHVSAKRNEFDLCVKCSKNLANQLLKSLEVPGSHKEFPKAFYDIYTDGACQGNPGPCGYGVLIEGITPKGKKMQLPFKGFLGAGTNNIGELTAALAGLRIIKNPPPVIRVHTDSKYVIGVLDLGWAAKKNAGIIASAIAEIQRLREAKCEVSFHHVKGHSGHAQNDRVDELAGDAIRDPSSARVCTECILPLRKRKDSIIWECPNKHVEMLTEEETFEDEIIVEEYHEPEGQDYFE